MTLSQNIESAEYGDISFLTPGRLDILTVDSAGANRKHQGLSLDYHPGYGLYRLDYSICCPKPDEPAEKLIPLNFVEMVNSKSGNAQKNATAMYQNIAKKLKDKRADTSLSKTAYKKAFTFSMLVNPEEDYQVETSFFHITDVKIDKEMDYSEANKKMSADRNYTSPYFKNNTALHVWREVIARDKFGPDASRAKIRDMSYEEISMRTSRKVQNKASLKGFEDGIELVQRKKGGLNAPGDYYLSTHMIAESCYNPNRFTADITHSREFLPAVNNLLFSCYLENGRELFSREVTDSLAIMAQRSHQKNRYRTMDPT